MTLTIRTELDNAVFEECGTEEIARILADLCTRLPEPIDQTGGDLILHDLNGNFVGTAEIKD